MESCLALTHLEVEGDPGFSGEKKKRHREPFEAELFWESIDRRFFGVFFVKLSHSCFTWGVGNMFFKKQIDQRKLEGF